MTHVSTIFLSNFGGNDCGGILFDEENADEEDNDDDEIKLLGTRKLFFGVHVEE